MRTITKSSTDKLRAWHWAAEGCQWRAIGVNGQDLLSVSVREQDADDDTPWLYYSTVSYQGRSADYTVQVFAHRDGGRL